MRGINYIEKKIITVYSLVLVQKSQLCVTGPLAPWKPSLKIITGCAKYSSSPTSTTICLLQNNQKGIILVRNWWMPDGVELVFYKDHVLKRLPRRGRKISAHLIVRNFAHFKVRHRRFLLFQVIRDPHISVPFPWPGCPSLLHPQNL